MFLGNLTGHPCMVLPVGYGKDNLPISLQIMASWWNEHMMLRVAYAAEAMMKDRKQPQIHYSIL